MGKYLIHYKERSIKDLTPFRFGFGRLNGLQKGVIYLNKCGHSDSFPLSKRGIEGDFTDVARSS